MLNPISREIRIETSSYFQYLYIETQIIQCEDVGSAGM